MAMTIAQLSALSLSLLACGLLLAGGLLFGKELRAARSRRVIGRAISSDRAAPEGTRDAFDALGPLPQPAEQELPAHWLRTRWGRLLVADEDRRLIEQCGWNSLRAQLALMSVRIVLAVLLPAFAWFLVGAGVLPQRPTICMMVALTIGFMAPKWLLARMAAKRRARAAQELPLFVDLLRLLQGVGMSLDQSLQVMVSDFAEPLQVLGHELAMANRQYAQGRTREYSLQRLATLHDNPHLAGLVALLVQVDRHGGAVQEPLARYSERLREHRRSELKARIGKITVKMTGVMVTTLLPALVIITAGPGFLAIVRSLGALAK
jgi:tight adherence protein C